jgi:hypothetical protein
MGPGRFYLDFQDTESYRLPVPASYAFIVAAATNYDRCETDPSARKINVEQTPRLVESLLSQGLFVTLISTNSVFGGERAWPHEEDPHDARIAYAIQKHEAEKDAFAAAKALGASDRFNVIRLTKILACETPPDPLTHWTREDLVRETIARGIAPTISASTIGRFLKSGGPQAASHPVLAQSQDRGRGHLPGGGPHGLQTLSSSAGTPCTGGACHLHR